MLFLYLILLLTSNNTFAQSTKTIRLTPRLTETHTFHYPTKDIEIFLANGDTSRLGYVQTGMLNKLREALPDKPFLPYLQDYMDLTYGTQFKTTGTHLLLVIKYLRIGERSAAASEKAFVRIKADAFNSADKQSYQFAGAIDTVLERSGVDVTSSHNLQLENALDLLVSIADKGPLRSPVHTRDEVIKRELHLYNAPAYTTNTFKPGVYMSFNEFIMNEPSITEFSPEIKEGTAVIFDSNHHPISNPWGMYYKKTLFKYHKRIFIPLVREGRTFPFYLFLTMPEKNFNIFGNRTNTIGPFLTEQEIKQDPMGVRAFPYIHGLLPEATTIDPFTGELMF